MADFAPVMLPGKFNQTILSDVRQMPPPGKLDKTRASSVILHIWSIMCKYDVIHKIGSTLCIAMP